MKFRITIEQVDEAWNSLPKAPKTRLQFAADEETQPVHLARFKAVTEALSQLIQNEGLRYANAERAATLESLDGVLDTGEADGE